MKFLEVENKKVNWKYILITALLATLAGGFTFVYHNRFPTFSEIPLVIKPIKPEPEGWKVFTNNELGFSFKYPAAWGDVEETIRDADISGKKYSLKFTNINPCVSAPVDGVCVAGRSKDFAEGRGSWITDYAGDPDKPKQISASTYQMWCTIPNFARIDFNLPGKEISGVRLFIPILSKNDAEKFNQECGSEDLEQEKEICVYYHCPDSMRHSFCDIAEDINKYLKDLEHEELDSTSQERIEEFKEIFNSSKIL